MDFTCSWYRYCDNCYYCNAKKHFKTMLFLVFLIGFAFLFYWANSKFAFSFSEDMACKEIVRGFDSDDYTSEIMVILLFIIVKLKMIMDNI